MRWARCVCWVLFVACSGPTEGVDAGRDAGGADAGTASDAGGAEAGRDSGEACERCGGSTCVDLTTNPVSCGSCGNACPAETPVCRDGGCVIACPAGQIECDGACVTVATDRTNCGECRRRCAAGEVCSASECRIDCSAPNVPCTEPGGAAYCADLSNDESNCGACGDPCDLGLTCLGGACQLVCTSMQTMCTGACVDLRSDPRNCGACGTSCNRDHGVGVCRDRVCALTCETGYGDCNGRTDDGCETNVYTSPTDCGVCGNVCALPFSTASNCTAGRCVVETCAAGRGDCDMLGGNGCEVDLQNDTANCGACGMACAGGRACMAGVCRFRPLVGAAPSFPSGGGHCSFSPSSGSYRGVEAALDEDNRVYVVVGCTVGGVPQVTVAISEDGGLSFTRNTVVGWGPSTWDPTAAVAGGRPGQAVIAAGGTSSEPGRISTTSDGGRTWSMPEVVPTASGQWYFNGSNTDAVAWILVHGDRVVVSDSRGVHSRAFAGGAWSHAPALMRPLASGATTATVWSFPRFCSEPALYRSDDGGISFGPAVSLASTACTVDGTNGTFFAVSSDRGGSRFTDPAVLTSLTGGPYRSGSPSLDALVGADGTIFALSGSTTPLSLVRVPPTSTGPVASGPIGSGWPWPPAQAAYGNEAILLRNGQFVAAP